MKEGFRWCLCVDSHNKWNIKVKYRNFNRILQSIRSVVKSLLCCAAFEVLQKFLKFHFYLYTTTFELLLNICISFWVVLRVKCLIFSTWCLHMCKQSIHKRKVNNFWRTPSSSHVFDSYFCHSFQWDWIKFFSWTSY